ncbi:iron chelate uptake ABC transporter family permease subunit [Cellulomonas sp. ES6]|uniref:iron chelate uptake ABC transporter family permease subunit n=1 Tax=Cellulomonas sp. ES6 TaxID=3039384 RepID=UPI0024B7023F|nr:iron chelate uptake ABC transporter family permease subunit [Cellulomonas sp. ES6]WHP17276.1 iron chelate uptake ABC transporter family permease subunit [Cellulomonas sp. ES6]
MTTAAPLAPAPPVGPPAVAAPHAVRRVAWLAGGVVLLLLALLASLALGARPVGLGDVLGALTRFDPAVENQVVVHDLRLPRTVVGLGVGAALGLAGALIQGLTRNPLADPGILGVNAGASFAVVLGAALLGLTHITQYVWLAFAGAVLATVVVYLIGSAGRGGATPVRLTLAGMALGAVLQGVASGITLLRPRVFDSMRHWEAGSLAAASWGTFRAVGAFLVAGAVIALACARPLNAVALGDDLARTLGTRVGLLRVAVVAAVTLLCGAATAAAGPIAFVGLMVPHVARWLVGPDQRWLLPLTLLLAPALLLVSDVVGRLVLAPAEVQVALVTAAIGAPVLIALVRRRNASTL